MKAEEVFTPNDYPTHTYVERGDKELEDKLRQALTVPKMVVSLSGPSKSGKTVLVERVIGKERIILVSGAEIEKADQVWDRVLDELEHPTQTTEGVGKAQSNATTGEGGATGGIPGVLQGTSKISNKDETSYSKTASRQFGRAGLSDVVKAVAGTPTVILLDDFHYIERSKQNTVAKQIKAAAERNVRICVASVPHRKDDVVRGNPELRGRTLAIDTSFWTIPELMKIGTLGFEKLNAEVAPSAVERFAKEACGSPQLMQSLCLQACRELGLAEWLPSRRRTEIAEQVIRRTLSAVSAAADYSSLIDTMHEGPKIRGVERKEFSFTDGSKGDVYRCVLLALSQDPPEMSVRYDDLMDRVKSVCVGVAPSGSSVTEACKQIAKSALRQHADQRIVEFDDQKDTISIVDPYWLFYLRSSPQLHELGLD